MLATVPLQVSKVDLRFDAAPVARVVAELAPLVGKPLGADPSVAREIVAVRFRNTTPAAAMDRLAAGLGARWVHNDGRTVLIRTGDDRAAERRDFEAAFTKAFRRARAFQSIVPVDAEAYGRAVADREQLEGVDDKLREKVNAAFHAFNPIDRFAARLDGFFTPAYAMAFIDRHVVYHSAPNASQRPLAPAMSEAFRLYLDECAQARSVGASPQEPRASQLQVIVEDNGNVRFRMLDAKRQPLVGQWSNGLRGDFSSEGFPGRAGEVPIGQGPA